jgi:short-subunit dehydrogenase
MPMQESKANQAKLAVITGASSGIGAEYARQLAERNYDVLLIARNTDKLARTVNAINALEKGRAECLVAYLNDPQATAALAKTLSQRSDIYMLINNAGFGTSRFFADLPVEKPLAMIRVHNLASVHLSHAVLPQMLARKAGAIINVSSVAAFISAPHSVIYTASKAFLNTFSVSLAAEVKNEGIKVQALCPGFTYTDFHDTADLKNFKRSDIPSWMWMQADEVVRTSLKALGKNKPIVIPGFKYRLIVSILRWSIVQALLHKQTLKQRKRK